MINLAPGRDAHLGYIPVSQILMETPYRFRRPDAAAVDRLRASLSATGQTHPALLEERTDGYFRIIDGHRRIAAMRKIQAQGGTWDKILAHVVHAPTPALALRWITRRNTGALSFGATERGALYTWAQAAGVPTPLIARECGLTISEVEDGLELAEAPPALALLIDEARLEPLFAVMLLRRYNAWTRTHNGPLALPTAARILEQNRKSPLTIKGWRFLLDFYWSEDRPFMVESYRSNAC